MKRRISAAKIGIIMIRVILTLFFVGCTFSIVQAENANVPAVQITYFSPMSDGDVTEMGESSFSVPNPIVVINPIVFGDPEKHPGKTVIKQISADQYQIRITGMVYDFIADMGIRVTFFRYHPFGSGCIQTADGRIGCPVTC